MRCFIWFQQRDHFVFDILEWDEWSAQPGTRYIVMRYEMWISTCRENRYYTVIVMYFYVYTKVVCWGFAWFITQRKTNTHEHILKTTTHECQYYKIHTNTIDSPHPMLINVMCDNEYKWGGRSQHIIANKLQTVESIKGKQWCDINQLTSESALWVSGIHLHVIPFDKSDLLRIFVLTSCELDHFTPWIELTSTNPLRCSDLTRSIEFEIDWWIK